MRRFNDITEISMDADELTAKMCGKFLKCIRENDNGIIVRDSDILTEDMLGFLDNSIFRTGVPERNDVYPAMFMIKYGECKIPYRWIKNQRIKWTDLPSWCLVELANHIENIDKKLYNTIALHIWEHSVQK